MHTALMYSPATTRFIILLIVFFCQSLVSNAQGIRGKVLDTDGQPLPYASLYVQSLKDGASTNMQGRYEIRLQPGNYELIVQYVGYEAVRTTIQVQNEWLDKDFVLKDQILTLKEVEIRSEAEDPALTIMRRAIAKRKFHLLQYDSYSMQVYLKGTGQLTNAPFFLKKKLKEEGLTLDEAYTSESVSEVRFEQPDKIEEKVISIRTSGEGDQASPAPFINTSFYNDRIAESISPLSRMAFNYYKFEYLGSFREGNIEVNKIKVTPRSRGEQVFEGHIYIIENEWAIHSLDLSTSMLGFKVRAKQNYSEVAERVWMPVTHQYNFSGKFFGFAGEYQYLASCSDYDVVLNQDLMHTTQIIDEKIDEVPEEVAEKAKAKEKEAVVEQLANDDKATRKQFRKMMDTYEKESIKERDNPEVVRERAQSVDSLAKKRDSAYWEMIRPVPLSDKEIRGYQRDDSLAKVEEARITGKDPDKVIKKSKFSPTDIILGGSYNLNPKTKLELHSLAQQVNYNTVEGYNVNMGATLTHRYDSLRKRITFSPVVRYGFGSNTWYSTGRLGYHTRKGERRNTFFAEGGKFIEQFYEDAIHPTINTLSTLLFRRNFMKLYEKTFVKMGYKWQGGPAFSIDADLEYALRNELFNQSTRSLFYQESREFTDNRPENLAVDNTGFPEHNALLFSAGLKYRPGITYSIYNGRRVPNLSNAPTLLLNYRKGIADVLGSNVDFDFVEAGIDHGYRFGVSGKLEFELRAGAFLNNRQMYFMDFQHFDGNRTILSSLKPAGAFRLLDYYEFSDNSAYVSAHTHYQFRKFLFTQLPEIRFSGLRENIFVNYLKTQNSPHYYELGYGIDNIFRLFRVEVGASFHDTNFQEVGLRIGIASFISFSTD